VLLVCAGNDASTIDNQTMMKKIDPIDKHVGARFRIRRLMLKMTQSEIADGLGLTFQQVQKYEKGTNRISASRLQHLCSLLKVPMSFFFDGAPGANVVAATGKTGTDGEMAALNSVLATVHGIELALAFGRIGNAKVRGAIVALVEQLVAEQVAEPDSTVN
jgi:transcriptional regulator with XRE-family HTH domain